MKTNLKSILTVVLFGGFIVVFSLITIIKPRADYSYSERRTLQSFPAPDFQDMMSGKWMDRFESASLDQFPARDFFRSVKAYALKDGLFQMANHDIYVKDGYLAKLEYPVNEKNVEKSITAINGIFNDYLKDTDCKTYLSVIPDKNRFLAADSLYPTVDYPEYIKHVVDNVPFATYIDITDKLELSNFYLTDQHWKQETIVPVADAVLSGMNRENGFTFTENTLDADFYGTYASQSALFVKPEKIVYLTNEILDNCTVSSYATGEAKPANLYDLKKGAGRDGYEMFLQGSEPLLTIENPAAETDAELVIFRDSFGSSFTPLLIPAYKKITVVDLRYINHRLLGNYVEFKNQDVLFMYSTLILNNTISQ